MAPISMGSSGIKLTFVVWLCLNWVDGNNPGHLRGTRNAGQSHGEPTVDLSYVDTSECTQLLDGSDYRGNRAVTLSGLDCQRWDSNFPHQHSRNDVTEYPDAVHNEANYCRNPDHWDGIGPWCYTTDPDIRWRSCGIPVCPDCKLSPLGTEYRGTRSVTASGHVCQAWNSQYPHQHERNDPEQFPGAIHNEANYCRNPDGHGEGPWCYTVDPNVRWEHCSVPLCSGCIRTASGSDYRGSRSVTLSGRTCQRWDSQSPHQHDRNNVTSFPNAIYNEENYCRNPDNSNWYGPWCYTTDPDVRFEVCGIPLCPSFP